MANKYTPAVRAGDTVNGKVVPVGHGAPGPGRKKGSHNKKTAATRERAEDILSKILKNGPTPLEVMWKMMKGPNYPGGIKYDAQRLEAAKAAAPYVHPRLSSILLSGQLGITHEEALKRLERMEVGAEFKEAEDVPYEIIENIAAEEGEGAED